MSVMEVAHLTDERQLHLRRGDVLPLAAATAVSLPLYLIRTGRVQFTVANAMTAHPAVMQRVQTSRPEDGEHGHVLAVLGVDDCFGPLDGWEAIASATRTATVTVTALEPTNLVVVARADVLARAEAQPELAQALVGLLNQRLRRVERWGLLAMCRHHLAGPSGGR